MNRLLVAGFAQSEVETAIRQAQRTQTVLNGGGVGDWVKYLTPKLRDMQPQPQTGRLDMLVMSEPRTSEPETTLQRGTKRGDETRAESRASPDSSSALATEPLVKPDFDAWRTQCGFKTREQKVG